MDAWSSPDSKVHGANMGPIWGRHDPGGPHVGPVNFAIWKFIRSFTQYTCSHSCVLQCWVRYYFTNSLGLHLFVTTLEQLVLCCISCDGIHNGKPHLVQWPYSAYKGATSKLSIFWWIHTINYHHVEIYMFNYSSNPWKTYGHQVIWLIFSATLFFCLTKRTTNTFLLTIYVTMSQVYVCLISCRKNTVDKKHRRPIFRRCFVNLTFGGLLSASGICTCTA